MSKKECRKVLLPCNHNPRIPFKPIYNPERKLRDRCRIINKNNRQESCVVKDISMEVNINDLASTVKLIQKYENDSDNPIEAIYELPLFDSFVTKFIAIIDGKKVVGQVKEKEEALNEYDDGISSGQGAYLGQVKGNAFEISVGNLPPKKSVEIIIELNQTLPTEGGELAWIMQPELFPQSNQKYNANIDVKITNSKGLDKVYIIDKENVQIKIDGNVASFNHQIDRQIDLKSDFICIIHPSQPFQPMSIVEKSEDGKSLAVLLNYYPSYDHIDEDLLEPASEILFVIDRSGSMRGGRIQAVSTALTFFLQSLPESCIFNIIGFGSTYQLLFPKSVPYNEENLKKAQQHAKSLSANLGGTELYQPLEAIFKFPYDDNYPRQVFVLTDGGITNTENTLSLVRTQAGTTRVFSVGIGSGVSVPLVNGLALAGKGLAIFVNEGENEGMKTKVLNMLKCAMEPIFRNCKIEWPEKVLQAGKCQSYPSKIRPIFNGERLIASCLLTDISLNQLPDSIVIPLKGKGPDGEDMIFDLQVDLKNAGVGSQIHRIAAYNICKELEDGTSSFHLLAKKTNKSVNQNDIKKLMVELGVKYQFATSNTSFVALEERDEIVEGSMTKKLIPIAHKPKQSPNYQNFGEEELTESSISISSSSRKKGKKSLGLSSVPQQVKSFSRSNSIQKESKKSEDKKLMKKEKVEEKEKVQKKSKSSSKNFESVDFSIKPQNMSLKKSEKKSFDDCDSLSISEESKQNESTSSPMSKLSSSPMSKLSVSSSRSSNLSSPSNSPSISLSNSSVTSKDGSDAIILLQKAAGFWLLADVSKTFGVDVKVLTEKNPASSNPNSVDLWSTALMIAWLNKKCISSKDNWELVESKGKKFVKKMQIKNNLKDVDFLTLAQNYVNTL